MPQEIYNWQLGLNNRYFITDFKHIFLLTLNITPLKRAGEVETIKSRIKRAAKKHGVEISED